MDKEERKKTLRSWAIVFAIAIGFFIYGVVAFFTIGAKWPPPWRYGVIEDVPGQSPYSTSSTKEFPGYAPHPTQGKGSVVKQHVRGRIYESGKALEEKGQ